MPEVIDGNLTDILTLAVAGIYAAGRVWSCLPRLRSFERFISDLSYGVSIYPLLLLALTAFSSKATAQLMQGNKVIMSLAGIMALTVTLKRTFDQPKSDSNQSQL